jgi:hypothetical protein
LSQNKRQVFEDRKAQLEMIKKLKLNESVLTDWEIGFLNSIHEILRKQTGQWCPRLIGKQAQKLEMIFEEHITN